MFLARLSEVLDSGFAQHQEAEHCGHDGERRQHGPNGRGEVGVRRHRQAPPQMEVDQQADLGGRLALQPAVVDT